MIKYFIGGAFEVLNAAILLLIYNYIASSYSDDVFSNYVYLIQLSSCISLILTCGGCVSLYRKSILCSSKNDVDEYLAFYTFTIILLAPIGVTVTFLIINKLYISQITIVIVSAISITLLAFVATIYKGLQRFSTYGLILIVYSIQYALFLYVLKNPINALLANSIIGILEFIYYFVKYNSCRLTLARYLKLLKSIFHVSYIRVLGDFAFTQLMLWPLTFNNTIAEDESYQISVFMILISRIANISGFTNPAISTVVAKILRSRDTAIAVKKIITLMTIVSTTAFFVGAIFVIANYKLLPILTPRLTIYSIDMSLIFLVSFLYFLLLSLRNILEVYTNKPIFSIILILTVPVLYMFECLQCDSTVLASTFAEYNFAVILIVIIAFSYTWNLKCKKNCF